MTKAIELIILFNDTVSGVIKPFNPGVKLLGAENREKVTCYLDALLFAMFAKTTVFEAMIYHTFDDEARKKLVTILRLWVNMLRTGRLITIDIVSNQSYTYCQTADNLQNRRANFKKLLLTAVGLRLRDYVNKTPQRHLVSSLTNSSYPS